MCKVHGVGLGPCLVHVGCLRPGSQCPQRQWWQGLCRGSGMVPLPGLHSDSQDSPFCPLPPGPEAGQAPGWAAEGTLRGWNRRARESPGQASEPDRTQLSQDLGGGTLAIDTLPDNRTRVVVSAGGTWGGGTGRWGPSTWLCTLVRNTALWCWPWRPV